VRVGDPGLLAQLTAHAATLASLAGATVAPAEGGSGGSATVVVRGHEVLVPLDGVVDLAAELQRLDKVVVKAREDAEFLRKRLDNEDFVAKAPVEKVEELREKLLSSEARLAVLERSHARVRAALG
jgi:valyl-tRNA synthetase